MIGKNNLLLKTHTNLFLLYKQGFKGIKKYVESMENNSIFGGSKLLKVCRNLCRSTVPTYHTKNIFNPKCAYSHLYHSIKV